MRRKVPKKGQKKSVRKQVSKIPEITTYHKRGANRTSLKLPPGKKSVDNIEVALINHDWKAIDRLRRKNKKVNPLDGKKHYVPPRGFSVIVQVQRGGKTYHFTRNSPVDMPT